MDLCRLCLESPENDFSSSVPLFALDSDYTILEMENGKKITIADALRYIDLDLNVPPNEDPAAEAKEEEVKKKKEDDNGETADEEPAAPKPVIDPEEDSVLPKVSRLTAATAADNQQFHFRICVRRVWRSCKLPTSSSSDARRTETT